MQRMDTISKSARKGIIQAVRVRYQLASKGDKGNISYGVQCSVWISSQTCHQTNEQRLAPPGNPPVRSARLYAEVVRSALILIWEAGDRICGKRLEAAVPTLIQAMERHKHVALGPEVRRSLEQISAATIDRMLEPVRRTAGSRRRRPGPSR